MTKKTRRTKARRALLALSLVLVTMMVTVGGTIAWLTANTAPVVNTFTPSNINIELDESTGDEYPMVPGATIPKDPAVTVEAGSEPCYVFIKVEENNWTYTSNDADNGKNYITYAVDTTKWNAVPNNAGVYYCQVDASEAAVTKPILTGNQVTVDTDVTKAMMNALENGTAKPTLTFTAYAIQSAHLTDANGDGTVDVKDAWALIGA